MKAYAIFESTMQHAIEVKERMEKRSNSLCEVTISNTFGYPEGHTTVRGPVHQVMFMIGAFADEGEDNLVRVTTK